MTNQKNEMKVVYPKGKTAIIVVDPFNDFLSTWGKAYAITRKTIKQLDTVQNIKDLLTTAREEKLKIVYSPHHKHQKGSHSERKHLHPVHVQQNTTRIFAKDSWGGKFKSILAPQENEFIASEHSCSNGFSGTNLHAHLQEEGITHLIIIGMITNSCIEATVRGAIDLDYHVTLSTNAVAAFSTVEHKQATEERYPLLAHQVMDTKRIIEQLKSK